MKKNLDGEIHEHKTAVLGIDGNIMHLWCTSNVAERYDDVENKVKERTADLADTNQKLDLEIQRRVRSESALRASRERYRNIFENTPVALCETNFSEVITAINDLKSRGTTDFRRFFNENPDFVKEALNMARIQNVNPFAVKLYEAKSKHELLGPLEKICTLEAYEAFKELLASMAEGKTLYECESFHRTLKGERIFILVRFTIPNEEAGFSNLIVSVVDLTERKKAEDSLKESEQRLNDIIDFLPDSTFAIDKKSKVIAWNQSIEKMTGIAAKHMVGKKNYKYALPFYGVRRPVMIDLVFKPDEEIKQKYAFMRKEQKYLIAEKKFQTPNGKTMYLWCKAGPIYDKKGNVIGAIESIRDISMRKQAEDVLQKSEKTFRDLLENSPTGICIIQENRVVYMNSEQKRLLGTVPDSFHLKDLNVHPEDSKNFIQFFDSVFSHDMPIPDRQIRFYPFAGKGKPARLKWVSLRASLIEYLEKKAVLINMIDVTETKNLEKAIQFREKMASLGHVAAGLAHEIRNPLSGINLLLDVIRENVDDSENAQDIKELVNQAQEAANKIESVIKRILDFSRPNEPRLTLEDINIPIKEAVKLSQTVLRKSGIKIQCDLDQNIPKLYIDVQLIEQVILNFINNATEALKDKKGQKILIISSVKENDDIMLMISDSGIGIPDELRDKIFDPFFTTKNGGSGIGLSLCQRIIADHGGTIKVSCSELGGAEFRIKIPIEKRRFCK